MSVRRAPRRLERRHLPFMVRRRWWASLITLLLSPVLLGLGGLMLYFAWSTASTLPGALGASLCGGVFLLGSVIGLDRSFPFWLSIEADGFTVRGLIFTRHFRWSEVTEFIPRSNYRLPGYYASWSVDGSNHPRRHWSSLWFGFYEVPPVMEYGGKELTRLLRHAKRRADAGWPEPDLRTRQKA